MDIGWEISRMASSSCSPQSQRMLPTVSPVKHSEWRRINGDGITPSIMLRVTGEGLLGGGFDARCDDGESRPTYAPRVILSISVSESLQTASKERERMGGAEDVEMGPS